jgi:hypothetical protein
VITQEHIHTLSGRHVHDRDGDKIGTAGQVWTDAAGLPTWVSVRTGLFGLNESLVPLQDADVRDDRLLVPFDKATVKDAPNVEAGHDEPLSQAEVDQLYSYYGLGDRAGRQPASNGSYTAGESGYDRGVDYNRDADFARGTDYEAGAGQGNGHLRGDATLRSQAPLNTGTSREQTEAELPGVERTRADLPGDERTRAELYGDERTRADLYGDERRLG